MTEAEKRQKFFWAYENTTYMPDRDEILEWERSQMEAGYEADYPNFCGGDVNYAKVERQKKLMTFNHVDAKFTELDELYTKIINKDKL